MWDQRAEHNMGRALPSTPYCEHSRAQPTRAANDTRFYSRQKAQELVTIAKIRAARIRIVNSQACFPEPAPYFQNELLY